MNRTTTGNMDSKAKESYRVFVYGTLKKGYHNHLLLEDSEYLGPFVTEPEYTMHSLMAYPAVIPIGMTPITGEVYEVDKSTFKDLDRLEGYPSLYDRIAIYTDYGTAWMYVMPNGSVSRLRPIESGVWD